MIVRIWSCPQCGWINQDKTTTTAPICADCDRGFDWWELVDGEARRNRKMTKWISVDDRLPPPFEHVQLDTHSNWVLVYLTQGTFAVAMYYHNPKCWFFGTHSGSDVTHWMPLPPDPPTGDSDD